MNLIDDEYNITKRHNLRYQSLNSGFELTTKLRAGDKRRQIKKINLLIKQLCRNLFIGNFLRKCLCNGSLTDTRLTTQQNHAAQYDTAAQHPIKL